MKNITRSVLLCLCLFSLGAYKAVSRPLPASVADTPEYYQELRHVDAPLTDEHNMTYSDTLDYVRGSEIIVKRDTLIDPMRVVTNHFGKNWFLFATGGAHTFRGDYSGTSSFTGTISPDWSVGVGKWFTPGLALKLEFIKSESRGYTEFLTGHYGYGLIDLNDKNVPFRKMKTGWWDISGSVIFNLSRLFKGYEGMDSPRMMNQFMLALGFGGVHHTGYEHDYGSDNEWSGHVEFQYSRFFTPAKRFSLDFKLRGIFYQTNFDLEYGYVDKGAMKWDSNLGVDIGFTWYLGKKRPNGWNSNATKIYQLDYRQRDVLTIYESKQEIAPQQHVMTFYVFFPNNYSGRDDAPIKANSKVNALDYLAGGIYTQKKYSNPDIAKALTGNDSRLASLAIEDVPTERADQQFAIDFIPRGYEMQPGRPMSLSLRSDSVTDFYNRAGFVYAPIYDGPRRWEYRIDKATADQQLLSQTNYRETATYGLNSHQGLDLVRENMNVSDYEQLVSFADVYAAVNSYDGYITEYADPATVEKIRDVLNNCHLDYVNVYGCATSQDNNTGLRSYQVGIDRNSTLAENRAETVKRWLMQVPNVQSSNPIASIEPLSAIHKVSTPSTRDIEAKTNRCVKVMIIYYPKPNK